MTKLHLSFVPMSYSFSTDLNVYITGSNRDEFITILKDLKLLDKLPCKVNFTDKTSSCIEIYINEFPTDEEFHSEMIFVSLLNDSKLTEKEDGVSYIDFDTLMLCKCFVNNEPLIALDAFGKEQFGKIIWSKSTIEEKTEKVSRYIFDNYDAILDESGVNRFINTVTHLMTPYLIYNSNCNRYNLATIDVFQSKNYIDAIHFLNNLITECKTKINYDVTESNHWYPNKEALRATTGIDMIDDVLENLSESELNTNDSIELLTLIKNTSHINKIYINPYTGVDNINTVYGALITEKYAKLIKNIESDKGEELKTLLEKTHSDFLPCLGNVESDSDLCKLFSYIDYKYLHVVDINKKLTQLAIVLTTENLTTQTSEQLLFEMYKIKHKSFALFSLYKNLESKTDKQTMWRYNGHNKKYSNKFLENVSFLIDEIRQIPEEQFTTDETKVDIYNPVVLSKSDKFTKSTKLDKPVKVVKPAKPEKPAKSIKSTKYTKSSQSPRTTSESDSDLETESM